jgi:hypothetical protein
VSTIEKLLERKSSSSGLENREYDRRDRRADHAITLSPLKLAITSPTSGGLSVGVARSRTKATELLFIVRNCCTPISPWPSLHRTLHFRNPNFFTKGLGKCCIWGSDDFHTNLRFTRCITFLTLFLKLLGSQERFSKASAGSWLESCRVLFTKEYFPISVLCFLLLIFLS